MKRLFLIFICIITVFFSCREETIIPPQAERMERITEIHDIRLIDYYFYLRDRNNEKVIDYLMAENKYAEIMMSHTKELQEKLTSEMIKRIKEDDTTLPFKMDDYYYYHKYEKNKDYSIFCRRFKSMDAEEEILLDLNKYTDTYDYIDLGSMEISPDHNLLAYTIDTDGSEIYTLFIKDLRNNILLPDKIENTGSIVWGNDSDLIFYNTYNEIQRSHKILMHQLGESPEDPKLIFHEEDDSFYVYISKSRSKDYFFINSSSNTSSEVHYLRTKEPFSDFSLIQKRQDDIQYYIDHINDEFYIRTNEDALNYRLMKAGKDTIRDRDKWTDFIIHRDDTVIENKLLFQDHIIIQELIKGQRNFRVLDQNNAHEHYIPMEEEVYSVFMDINPQADTDLFRFEYTSFTIPDSIFEYNMKTREKVLLKQTEVLGGFDSSLYTMERIWADSIYDDAKIPISLVYKADLFEKNGSAPVFLSAYGSYGAISHITFSSSNFSLIDRGIIYAVAHIRGGGELGIRWHEEGKLLNRKNTFNDLISCAEFLIRENYTGKKNIIISGMSAGGKVIGAVVNKRPDLFLAAIADVPFVDVLNTMLDPTLPLTIYEYNEWGNPNEKIYFDYIASYCPYQNIKRQDYPNMLITAGLNDPRVGYWEPAKFTAKLREYKTDDNIILLKTHMGAGHFGYTGRYAYYQELAFYFAYILSNFGIY